MRTSGSAGAASGHSINTVCGHKTSPAVCSYTTSVHSHQAATWKQWHKGTRRQWWRGQRLPSQEWACVWAHRSSRAAAAPQPAARSPSASAVSTSGCGASEVRPTSPAAHFHSAPMFQAAGDSKREACAKFRVSRRTYSWPMHAQWQM